MNNSDLLHNAEKGLYKEVEKQINAGSNPNAVNEEGYSALMLAIRGPIRHREPYRDNKIKTIKILLEKGADINYKITKNINYKTVEYSPLFFAINYGELDIVKLLLTYPEINKTAALTRLIKQLCLDFEYYRNNLVLGDNILDFIDKTNERVKTQFDIMVELLICGTVPEIDFIKQSHQKIYFELIKIIFIYCSDISILGKMIDYMMGIDYGSDIHSFYINKIVIPNLYKGYTFKISPASIQKFNTNHPKLAKEVVKSSPVRALPEDLSREVMSYGSGLNLIELICSKGVKLDSDFLKLFGVKTKGEALQKAQRLLIRMTDNYGFKSAIDMNKIKADLQNAIIKKQKQEEEAESNRRERENDFNEAEWGATPFLKSVFRWKGGKNKSRRKKARRNCNTKCLKEK
jgi:hypothetical protein